MSTLEPRPRPPAEGCILALLQTSDSMGRGMAHAASMSKLQAARVFLDYLLDSIVLAYERRGAEGPGPSVAVVGYQADESGAPVYRSLLPGTSTETFWVEARTLAALPARPRKKGPRHWVAAAPSGGARMTAAFGLAHRLLRGRLASHPPAVAPLLVHCGDGTSDDGLPTREATSLRALATPSGNLALVQCVFDEECSPTAGLPDAGGPWEPLWSLSSPLDDPDGSRAFSINMWPRKSLSRFLDPILSGAAVADPPALPDPAPIETRLLKLTKGGNRDDQWEDACAVDPSRGVAAVCDGASEGIFVKAWAAILSRQFLAERPRVGDPAALFAWLEGCRREWKTEIRDPDGLNYIQKPRVAQVGGAATFLGVEFTPSGPGAETCRWTAWAVGDACLFQVRDNRLVLSFPAVAARDFGRAPALLRTLAQYPIPSPLCARGTCDPRDTFLLTTDAIGQWLLAALEDDGAVDWERYWTLDETAWEAELQDLRTRRKIVNDDCTLLTLRVRAPEIPTLVPGEQNQ